MQGDTQKNKPLNSPNAHHMSIEDANAMLWQQDSIPKKGFSSFKRPTLQELAARYNITVGRSGKKGRSVKRDYVEAISLFVRVPYHFKVTEEIQSL